MTFVTGDTGPDLTAVIFPESGDPTDPQPLTGCTVRFQMRKEDDKRYTVDAAAQVVNEAAGTVKYVWGANDLSVSGTYKAQWQVTFPGPKIITTVARDLEVRRQ